MEVGESVMTMLLGRRPNTCILRVYTLTGVNSYHKPSPNLLLALSGDSLFCPGVDQIKNLA